MRPVISLGEDQCFHEASEVPQAFTFALPWLHRYNGSYIPPGSDISQTYLPGSGVGALTVSLHICAM